MTYKIGQILTSKNKTEIEKVLSCEKVIIPKGNKIIIGADNLAHHIKNGFIQSLPEDSVVTGFSTRGLSEWIYIYLRNQLPIDEMLEDYDEDKEHFKEMIVEALEEIGFCE